MKLLSDGIADLLFTGSNRLETRTEVIPYKFPLFFSSLEFFFLKTDQTGLYLLRADQDLLDKFLPSNSRRTSITENEIEYFIANEEMISRVLNDYKTTRKVEANTHPPSIIRQQSSSASTPSPSSTHHRFFF